LPCILCPFSMSQYSDVVNDVYRNIEKIILRAYRWLSNHFQEDGDSTADQIYLFGMWLDLTIHRYILIRGYRFLSWGLPGPCVGGNDRDGE
jgi:hypothetical protein